MEGGGNESRTETDCRVRSGRRHGGFQRTGWSKSRPRRKRRGVVTTERDLIFVDRRVGQKEVRAGVTGHSGSSY